MDCDTANLNIVCAHIDMNIYTCMYIPGGGGGGGQRVSTGRFDWYDDMEGKQARRGSTSSLK